MTHANRLHVQGIVVDSVKEEESPCSIVLILSKSNDDGVYYVHNANLNSVEAGQDGHLNSPTPRVQMQDPLAVLQVGTIEHGLCVGFLVVGYMLGNYLTHETANVRVHDSVQDIACK